MKINKLNKNIIININNDNKIFDIEFNFKISSNKFH